MFEKEAEKWVENNFHNTEEDYIKAFQDGAEFGYNKADEQLTKVTEIIKLLLWDLRNHSYNPEKDMARAEEFLGRNK